MGLEMKGGPSWKLGIESLMLGWLTDRVHLFFGMVKDGIVTCIIN